MHQLSFKTEATILHFLNGWKHKVLGNVTQALNVDAAVNAAFSLLVKLEAILVWLWRFFGHSCKCRLMINLCGCILVFYWLLFTSTVMTNDPVIKTDDELLNTCS